MILRFLASIPAFDIISLLNFCQSDKKILKFAVCVLSAIGRVKSEEGKGNGRGAAEGWEWERGRRQGKRGKVFQKCWCPLSIARVRVRLLRKDVLKGICWLTSTSTVMWPLAVWEGVIHSCLCSHDLAIVDSAQQSHLVSEAPMFLGRLEACLASASPIVTEELLHSSGIKCSGSPKITMIRNGD
jgi:hypothetical protein